MNLIRWSCTTASSVIQLPDPEEIRDFCLCDYSAAPCPYYELAFADFDNSSDEYVNDYRKFLLNPLSLTSSFSFILIDKNNVEYVIYSFDGNDTIVSTEYADLSLQGFNESQELQVGINVLWYKVAFNLGFGDYTIKTSQTDFGNTVTKTSHTFKVVPYSAQRANGTIKIEVAHVGVTMNGDNWTGLIENSENVFTNMIRVNGRFTLTDPDIETESIVDGIRKTRPVQTKITDTYNISIERLPFGLGIGLIHDDIIMNWIVTDYNVFNEDLRNKELIVESSTVTATPDYARKSYELTAKSNIAKLNRKFV